MIKLVDVYSEDYEDVQFGTCALCMYTADLSVDIYLFEDEETGATFLIEGGYWDWGDYVEYDIDIPFTELAQRIKDAKIKTFKELEQKFPYDFL